MNELLGIDLVMKWIARQRVCTLPSVGDNCIGIFCVCVELRQVETAHTMSCGLPLFLVVVHQTFHIWRCILVRYFFHWKSPRFQYTMKIRIETIHCTKCFLVVLVLKTLFEHWHDQHILVINMYNQTLLSWTRLDCGKKTPRYIRG